MNDDCASVCQALLDFESERGRLSLVVTCIRMYETCQLSAHAPPLTVLCPHAVPIDCRHTYIIKSIGVQVKTRIGTGHIVFAFGNQRA